MTDAERIAAYLNIETTSVDWTADDIMHDIKLGEYGSRVCALASMLADVRREEREACLADIDAENELSRDRDENNDALLVRLIRVRIRRRGPQ